MTSRFSIRPTSTRSPVFLILAEARSTLALEEGRRYRSGVSFVADIEASSGGVEIRGGREARTREALAEAVSQSSVPPGLSATPETAGDDECPDRSSCRGDPHQIEAEEPGQLQARLTALKQLVSTL